MKATVVREARTRFLSSHSAALPTNEDVEHAWQVISEVAGNSETISFEEYTEMKDKLGAMWEPYFTAATFLRLPRDRFGRVSVNMFFNYIVRKIGISQTRISLSYYDVSGDGVLREQDLEQFIFEMIPSMPQLATLEQTFYPFYVCHAVRKFLFFLDTHKRGRILIKDMLVSPVLAELFEMREEEVGAEESDMNWFSVGTAQRVYSQYLHLDVDRNGMLNKEELKLFGAGTLTDVFLERLFQVHHTYVGEMDYKTYLDFVLAMENRNSEPAINYFFRILDTRGDNRLTLFDLNVFFRGIQKEMAQNGYDVARVEDVTSEIFDMVKPAGEIFITQADLHRSLLGSTVVAMLIDTNAFWAYDNREALVQEH